MPVKQAQAGYILLIVLMLGFLFSLFLYYITQTVMLEYQRVHSQLLDFQALQQLECKVHTMMSRVQSKQAAPGAYGNLIGYMPDTLEFNCLSGINVYKLEERVDNYPIQLAGTYSFRQ